MYNIKVNETEVGWTPLEMAGVSMKVLHLDEATRAMAVLTRMDPAATIPAHFHTKADERVYVLGRVDNHASRIIVAAKCRNAM